METVLICWTTLILVPLCRQGKMKLTLVNRFVFCLMLISFFHHYSCSYSSLWPPFLACSFLALCPLPSCFWSFLFLLRRSVVRTACCICIGCFHTWVASSVRMTHMIYTKITFNNTLIICSKVDFHNGVSERQRTCQEVHSNFMFVSCQGEVCFCVCTWVGKIVLVL